jgi:hypothetical protein
LCGTLLRQLISPPKDPGGQEGESNERKQGDEARATKSMFRLGVFRCAVCGRAAGLCVRTRNVLDRRNEAVAAARDGFNEAGVFGGFAQCLPKSLYGGVEVVVEFHKRIRRPQPVAEFFSRYNAAGSLQKKSERLKRFLLQLDQLALSSQLASPKMNLEESEARECPRLSNVAHS